MSGPVHDHAAQTPDFSSPIATAPAFLLLICWSLLLLLTVDYAFPTHAATAISMLLSLSWWLIGTTSPNKGSLPFLLIVLTLMLSGAVYISHTVSIIHVTPESIRGTGVIISEREWGYKRVAVAASDTGRYLLRLDENSVLKEGDVVAFEGTGASFERAKADRDVSGPQSRSTFDELLYWRAKGVICAVENPHVKVVGVSAGAARWRELLNRRIESTLPTRTAGYLMASWTGARDRGLESLHRSVGTSHLLAVSGFHVAIVFSFCWLIFRRAPLRLYIISVFIWLYVILSGAAPSALRSAAMIQVVICGRLLGRPSSGFNSVSFAGAAMLILNPWLFWDLGWRLSMLSVLCITAVPYMPLIKIMKQSENKNESLIRRTSIFVSGALVWLATGALCTWVFKEVPLVGLFINFIAIPVFAFLLPAAFALSLPALLGLPGGYIPANLSEFLFKAWERFSGNMLYLCPYQIQLSFGLLLLCSVTVVYFFANASGFSRQRALLAGVITAVTLLML